MRVDGVTTYRTLGCVVVPMLAPSLVAVAVLGFIFSCHDYLFALVLSSWAAIPMTLDAANFVTSTEGVSVSEDRCDMRRIL